MLAAQAGMGSCRLEHRASSGIAEQVKQLLATRLQVRADRVAAAGPDTPLLGEGIALDSVEAVALVCAVEEEFGIRIADEDLTADLFRTLGTFAEHVRRVSGAGATGPG